MKKLVVIGACATLGILASAFTFFGTPASAKPVQHPLTTTLHTPFFAVFDADSFYCDPAEAKHQGAVRNRFNTLHMKEKGPDNVIVHFKSKKFSGKNGKPENNYVHFDILLNEAKTGNREDTHLSLDWKGKKYHLKNGTCSFFVSSLTWSADKTHFTFSADFSARVSTGGSDTTSHIFKGKIVDELVKAKVTAPK
ncbi:MAG: hypothetical protein IAF38_15445 [Bacteroidia bacterium]|nr:hypothetical protein [Bacteroidia bacterium]